MVVVADVESLAQYEEHIPLDLLFRDDSYGRPVNQARLAYLRKHWDLGSVGVLQVSKRLNGLYALLDGVHRKMVAQEQGIYSLPCLVHTGLGLEQEANMFRNFNDPKRILVATPNDIFFASLTSRDSLALGVMAVLQDVGLALARTSSQKTPGHIRTPNCLYAVFKATGNGLLLGRTLGLLVEAWGNATTSFYDSTIRGLALFLKRYPDCDEKLLVQRLKTSTPKQMLASAKGAKVTFPNMQDENAYGLTLWNLYNWRLSTNRLADWSPSWRLGRV